MSKKLMTIFMLLTVFALVLAACGPQTEAPAATEEATEAPMATEEATEEAPMATEEAPAGPAVDPTGQTIVFWHVWGQGAPAEAMQAIVDEFNATNEWGITVEAVDQGRYGDLEDAFNAAIQSGDLPDIVVAYANALANWYAVDAVVDMSAYVNDADFGLAEEDMADFYPSVFASMTATDGAMVGFPISQSANVMFYNTTWAQELGFNAPPATAEEFKAQACAAAEANANDDDPDNDGTGGLVLYPGASNAMSWIFAFDGDIVGPDGAYDFTSQPVVDVATFWKDLWDSGCAFATESYPNPEFASRKALFTMSSTAGIKYQVAAFDDEGATDDEWMLIPFVGPNGTKAVDAFTQSVGIVNTTPERQMAAWIFIQYLTSPEVQAKWIEGSAYYPTRMSTNDYLADFAANNPQWAMALDLLQYGKSEPARPSWTSLRREVGNTFQAIISGTVEDIVPLLEDLNAKAAEIVAETEE